MVNIELVLENVIETLNEDMTGVKTIKNYNIKRKPPYPYMTATVSTGYISGNQSDRPNLYMTYDQDADKGIYRRSEDHQMTFSINAFSDNQLQASQVCATAVSHFKFLSLEKLKERGIIVLEVTQVQNRTALLEVDYIYQYGFDVRVRVNSTLSLNYEVTKGIEVNNELIK